MQYVLPLHISCLQDENTAVAVESAEGIVELLDIFNAPRKRLTLTPTDFHIFSRYIFPECQKFCSRKDVYSTSTFIKCMGKLAVHGKRLIERGMIAHIKYLYEIATKEPERKGRGAEAEAVTSPFAAIATYETEVHELFSSLHSFCTRCVTNFSYVEHCNLPNHFHEYQHKNKR